VHTDADKPSRPRDNDIHFPLDLMMDLQELTLHADQGRFGNGMFLESLKKLYLQCAYDAIPHNLGDMLPRLETLELTCWSTSDEWRQFHPHSAFPSVTHLALYGDTFNFYLQLSRFPKLESLEIWYVHASSCFDLGNGVLDTALVTPSGSLCLVAEDAHIRNVTVLDRELGRLDFVGGMWMRGIRVHEIDFQPTCPWHLFDMFVPVHPTIVHLRMAATDLEALCKIIRRLLRADTALGWDLLDIDVLPFPQQPAGSAGRTTQGRIAVTTDNMKRLPKSITLRCSARDVAAIPVPGYTEAREYSKSVIHSEEIVLNLSIPDALRGVDQRKTFG